MADIPNLSALTRANIQIARNDDQINFYYVAPSQAPSAKPKKIPLHVKTNCWTCPFGRDDQNNVYAVISSEQFFNIEDLDRYGRDVCKYFLKSDDQPVPDELPYKSMIQQVDGLDVLQLRITEDTRVFDNNNIKLSKEQADQWMSVQFSGNFMLSFSMRISSTGNYYWVVKPVQIKVKRYFALPQGCKIFDNDTDLAEEMDRRKEQQPAVPDVEEALVDFDPDVNELLD